MNSLTEFIVNNNVHVSTTHTNEIEEEQFNNKIIQNITKYTKKRQWFLQLKCTLNPPKTLPNNNASHYEIHDKNELLLESEEKYDLNVEAINALKRDEIDSTIIKILKTKKTLKYSNLLNEIIKELNNRFILKPIEIEPRIIYLIQSKFIETVINEKDLNYNLLNGPIDYDWYSSDDDYCYNNIEKEEKKSKQPLENKPNPLLFLDESLLSKSPSPQQSYSPKSRSQSPDYSYKSNDSTPSISSISSDENEEKLSKIISTNGVENIDIENDQFSFDSIVSLNQLYNLYFLEFKIKPKTMNQFMKFINYNKNIKIKYKYKIIKNWWNNNNKN